MKKFLIGGVSLFAILSANNAMAAGYTCEELIEYTSCNPGYYLSAQDDRCPEGTMYITGVCDWTESYDNVKWNLTEAECYEEDSSAVYRPEACLRYDSLDEENSWANGVDLTTPNGSSVVMSCNECPAGSICAGGTVAAAPCPAGSYCATTKLKEPTGLCALNSYSTGGAITCSACPATELTDKDGKTVLAKTAATGTDTPAKCFIDPDAYFKNTKGTYHFKSNCAFDLALQPSCEYYEMFIENNPTDYTCKEDQDYVEGDEGQLHYTCDLDDSDCMKNHIQNCKLYQTAYENEECDDDGCTVDLGNGIMCRYTY